MMNSSSCGGGTVSSTSGEVAPLRLRAVARAQVANHGSTQGSDSEDAGLVDCRWCEDLKRELKSLLHQLRIGPDQSGNHIPPRSDR